MNARNTVRKFSTFLLLLGAATAFANPTFAGHAPVSTRLLKEYPAGAPGWIENLAARSNGELLFTSIGTPGNLHIFKPLVPNFEPVEISGFDYHSTLGIVEAQPDVFYVLSGDFDVQTVTVGANTNTVWEVDFNRCNRTTGLPTPKKIATLSNATFLNGLTNFDDDILLAADSGAGVVWAIDTRDGTSRVVADDPLMKPVEGQPFLEGINGLHIRPNTTRTVPKQLCFTNSQRCTFSCIELGHDATAQGSAWHVADSKPEKGVSVIKWDDFAFDREGIAYIATENGNSVQAVTARGQVRVLAGDLNSTTIGSPTSTVFGRTLSDFRTLYVGTAGNFFNPIIVDGENTPTGAQLIAVDLL